MGINSAYINSSLSNLEINDILLKVKNEDIKSTLYSARKIRINGISKYNIKCKSSSNCSR